MGLDFRAIPSNVLEEMKVLLFDYLGVALGQRPKDLYGIIQSVWKRKESLLDKILLF